MQDAKTSLRASLKALGLLEGATQSEIREAYLRLTKVRPYEGNLINVNINILLEFISENGFFCSLF